MNIAIYPGSFDPFTNGHLDILKRAKEVFDQVIVLVAINSAKQTQFSVEERVEILKEIFADVPGVIVDSYDGLTVDYARKVGRSISSVAFAPSPISNTSSNLLPLTASPTPTLTWCFSWPAPKTPSFPPRS